MHDLVPQLPSVMRLRVVFSGRVQGVGFRATVRSISHRHGLTGWVRNEPDGSVLAELQGSPEHIEGVLTEIRAVFAAHLRHEQRFELPHDAQDTSFEITR